MFPAGHKSHSVMRKLFSKNPNHASSHSSQAAAAPFVGKSFQVGRTLVTVEDVIAEGES